MPRSLPEKIFDLSETGSNVLAFIKTAPACKGVSTRMRLHGWELATFDVGITRMTVSSTPTRMLRIVVVQQTSVSHRVVALVVISEPSRSTDPISKLPMYA